jgi:hypothetical protein
MAHRHPIAVASVARLAPKRPEARLSDSSLPTAPKSYLRLCLSGQISAQARVSAQLGGKVISLLFGYRRLT